MAQVAIFATEMNCFNGTLASTVSAISQGKDAVWSGQDKYGLSHFTKILISWSDNDFCVPTRRDKRELPNWSVERPHRWMI